MQPWGICQISSYSPNRSGQLAYINYIYLTDYTVIFCCRHFLITCVIKANCTYIFRMRAGHAYVEQNAATNANALWPLLPQRQILWQDALTHTHPLIYLAVISVSRLPWSSNYACCTHKIHVRQKDEPASRDRHWLHQTRPDQTRAGAHAAS